MSQEPLVDRREELAELHSILVDLSAGRSIRFPIRAIVGPGAIGKTAFLKAVYQESRALEIPTAFIECTSDDLSVPNIYSALRLIADIRIQFGTMARDSQPTLAKPISSPITESSKAGNSSAPESERAIAEEIDSALAEMQSLHCVVILDSVDQVPGPVLQLIGEHVLFPISDSGRVLVLVASRVEVDWGTPRYKLSRRTRTVVLDAFSLEDTTVQLARSDLSELGREVYGITGGHPGGTGTVIRLLKDIQSIEGRVVNRARFSDYEARLVEAVVDEVVREEVGVPAAIFQAMYALSCVRSFDVDIPVSLLSIIDPSRDWAAPLSAYSLLKDLTDGAPELVGFVPGRNAYIMRPFLRRVLSLHMRLFNRDKYLMLSQIALDYYGHRLEAEPSNPYLILDRLYHFADLAHMSDGLYGAGLTTRVQRAFRDHLRQLMGGISASPMRPEANVQGLQRTYEQRLRDLQHLRTVLQEDEEMAELLGDTESLLLEILDSTQSELLNSDRAALEVLRRPGAQGSEEEYSLTFVTESGNVHITFESMVSTQRRTALLADLDACENIRELETLGRMLRNMFVPVRLQESLSAHTGPLLLSVNDMEVPWELIHDGNEFLGLRLAVGTKARASDFVKGSPYFRPSSVRPLLVGVTSTVDEELSDLPAVRDEIEAIRSMLETDVNGWFWQLGHLA